MKTTRLAAAALFGLCLLPSRLALAQATPGPPLPIAMDLARVPVGSWSAYTVTLAGMPPFQQRFSLVGRDGASATVEMIAEGGSVPGGGRVALQVMLGRDLSKEDRMKKVVMQLGDNAPMEVKGGMGVTRDQFAPLDPKKLVGGQTIKVAAGTFKTKHYRDKSGTGETVDMWVSDEAPPFGLVKLQGAVAQGPGAPTFPLTMELAGKGGQAKAVITKPARPFDPATLMSEMNRGFGGPGAKGDPHARPPSQPGPPAGKAKPKK